MSDRLAHPLLEWRTMNLHVKLASCFALLSMLVGCASTTDHEPSDQTVDVNEDVTLTDQATTGADLGGGDTVTTTTTAERPKISVADCIAVKTVVDGWSQNRATAYCKCRATGKSDWVCNYEIPYIDL